MDIVGVATREEFEPPVLLAQSYWRKDGRAVIKSPSGWLASEKYDGYRAVWTGKQFVSRTGKTFAAPDWFEAIMPAGVPLDGEFWLGRGNFENCGMFRRKTPKDEDWVGVKFVVFDAPGVDGPFSERLQFYTAVVNHVLRTDPRSIVVAKDGALDELLPEEWTPLQAVAHSRIKDAEHLSTMLRNFLHAGAEGLMLRNPDSTYEQKRSRTLLKMKPSHDAEAVVIAHKPGEGKYAKMLGAFVCRPVDGAYGDQLASCTKLGKGAADADEELDFCLSGMTDAVRKSYKKTHPVGTVITFTYTELTERGKPRHPRYLRIHQAHE